MGRDQVNATYLTGVLGETCLHDSQVTIETFGGNKLLRVPQRSKLTHPQLYQQLTDSLEKQVTLL